uniref:BTB domain-containing protein n=1 Tax=Panagrolaimus sp. ES5 TaxID=591445 RepID=A0AC34EZF3_9BILA
MDLYPSFIPIQHSWTVSGDDIEYLENFNGSRFLKSDVKKVKEIPGVEFQLELDYIYVMEENGDEKNVVRMCVSFLNLKENAKIHGKFSFIIKSADFSSPYSEGTFSKSGKQWQEICALHELLDAEKKFFVDGELNVEMKGMIYFESSEGDEKDICQPSLGQFLWSRDDQDFTINVGKNGVKTEVKIHKLILAARSPVFDAMIKADMKEKAEGKVQIIDFDAEIVQAAVEFCYDQDISEFFDSLTNTCALFQFADKYDIADLKARIEMLFVKGLTPQTIGEITNAAVITTSLKLQELCFRFLLMFLRQSIPVDNFAELDKNFGIELLEKAFSPEYC